MALIEAETTVQQFNRFSGLPPLRQLGLMLGLAISVALGVAVVMWSQQPQFVPLYGGMSESDIAQVIQQLDQRGVTYQLQSGTVAVPAEQVHETRISLASQGLPAGSGQGFDILDKEQAFGTSSFMENARYNRALEVELARSIAALNTVTNARVHLAIPKQSVFSRGRNRPSASVLVNLHAGRRLNDVQVAGIVHLVASSVMGMEAENVTVVDQQGRLLTSSRGSDGIAQSTSQLRFTRELENSLSERIVELLSPIVGAGKVQAQVAADVDFSQVEKTLENYAPEGSAEGSVVRSEQTSEETMDAGSSSSGVPGALANQPPEATGVVEGAGGEEVSQNSRLSRSSTRNYELDRTISHIRQAPGSIRRLSVAVLVDHRERPGTEGQGAELTPLTPDELKRLETLVKDAVGFNAARGDSVNIINESFLPVPSLEPVADPPVWEQPWVAPLARNLLAGGALALLVFGVLRPVLKTLANNPDPHNNGSRFVDASSGGAAYPSGGLGLDEDRVSIGGHGGVGGMHQLPLQSYEQQLSMAQTLAGNDPRRVAQVVKGWVANDG